MDKAAFFILNIVINSFLAFFTAAFLIECLIFLFRIPQGRAAALLRMIPIFKMPFDICLYDFQSWSYLQGINPWACETGTRTLSVMLGWTNGITDRLVMPFKSGVQFTLPGNLTFTIADLLGYSLSPCLLKGLVMLWITMTLGVVFRKLGLYYHSIKSLKLLYNSAKPSSRKMKNSILSASIKKYAVIVKTLPSFTGSPFVTGLKAPVVYISDQLSKNLSRKEYEAVIAHEMEHVRYKDGFVRIALDGIRSFFWWIPTKWLYARIEEGQEVGCDHQCKRYGIDSLDLASALCKSAKYSINTRENLFAHQLTKHTIDKRIKLLLRPPSARGIKLRCALTCLAFGMAFCLVLVGRFWMF